MNSAVRRSDEFVFCKLISLLSSLLFSRFQNDAILQFHSSSINIILNYDVYDDLVLSNFMFVCLYMSACLLFVQQIFRKQIGQFE